MKRLIVLAGLFGAAVSGEACSSTPEQSDAGGDAAQNDVTQQDVVTTDVVQDVINDVMEAGCPATWTALPDAGGVLPVPDGGGGVLIHAAASGTQNYMCEATGDAGAYAWTFVGPQATLSDCEANVIGHHFASEAGATAPEWQTTDMSYVIGKKMAAFDAGSASVPWLLLQATSTGGSGTISRTLYVQRLFTSGGDAPTTTCDVNSAGMTVAQPYTADYYFYGN